MERGVVDGFIWPMYAGFSDMGLQEVTKFVVDHGVYRGPSGFFMNQKAWDKLPKNLQDLVLEVRKETMAWGEKKIWLVTIINPIPYELHLLMCLAFACSE